MEVNLRDLPLRRVIVHCGLTKTGSTALQMQLFDNRERLLSHRYYVPKTGISQDDRMPGVTRTDGHRFVFSPNGTEQDWIQLKAELGDHDLAECTLVLSCENLTQAGPENFQAICDRFLGTPVQFHFVVRDFPSWLSSQVAEYAVGGNTRLMLDDPRLSHDPRYGIVHMVERLCVLEQSHLDVQFHSYELLKGADIAGRFLRAIDGQTSAGTFAESALSQAGNHNSFKHNSRFTLLAMMFNARTRHLSHRAYQAPYAGLLELAKQPFYHLETARSCGLSSALMGTLQDELESLVQDRYPTSRPLQLLFPTGRVAMPEPASFDAAELDRITADLHQLLIRHRLASPPRLAVTSLSRLVSGISSRPGQLIVAAARAGVRVLRRTRRGTDLVVWLRRSRLLRWLYDR